MTSKRKLMILKILKRRLDAAEEKVPKILLMSINQYLTNAETEPLGLNTDTDVSKYLLGGLNRGPDS